MLTGSAFFYLVILTLSALFYPVILSGAKDPAKFKPSSGASGNSPRALRI